MEITYDLTINNIECLISYSGLTNVVNKIYWTYRGYDETNRFASSIVGCTKITFNNNNQFIQFENLTNNQVISWITEQIGNEEINNIRSKIYNDILSEKNSNIINQRPPWNI